MLYHIYRMKEPIEMFLLTPAYFNSKLMKHNTENIYTVSFPLEEMDKFESQDDINDFLFHHYDEIFFQEEGYLTEKIYELYFQKKAEKNLTEKE